MKPTVSQDGDSTDAFSPVDDPSISQVFGDPIHDLHLTLWDIFESAAASKPDGDAIVSMWQPRHHLSNGDLPSPPNGKDKPYLNWTYAQLRDKAERVAETLESLGCRPGMRLAVVLSNCAEWALFFWAAAKLRMVFVPIDPTVPRDARAAIISVKAKVVVAQDAEAAKALDLPTESRICIVCAEERMGDWLELPDVLSPREKLLESAPKLTNGVDSTDTTQDDDAALIIFTSGTTGQPKGCIHTNANLISQCCDFDPEVNAMGKLRWLIHTPVSHVFAINNTLRAWRWSGLAVIPSKTFNVDATLDALVKERCHIMSATPTLVKALMSHPNFPSVDQLDLRIVTIGGASIGPEDIKLCREGLGAQMAIQVFGMSEGAPIITWKRADPDLVGSWHPGVGKVLPGAAVRICRPETREILPRSEIGELHIGGTSVISKYYDNNRGSDGAMYTDETGNWLATGDQARIDDKGIVYILGRYKDLIIRGGENIYPLKIEQVLLQQHKELQVQVVGVPDDLAGQVAVAVVILPENLTKSEIIETARNADQRYALDGVYTLQELGLEKFPLTSLGKVKKEQLKAHVLKLRQGNSSPKGPLSSKGLISPISPVSPNGSNLPKGPINKATPIPPFVNKLLSVCEQLIGIRPSITESFKHLADSITLLRYCDRVLRACGQRLYLQDLIEHDTIEKQAHLLLSRKFQQARLVIAPEVPKPNPIQPRQYVPAPNHDIPTTTSACKDTDKDTLSHAKRAVARAGFSPSEIEDVLPIRHSLHRTAIGSRPQSYHNRMVFRICNVAQHQILRALEKALVSRPMLRTIVFPDSNRIPFHAVLAPSPALFAQLIHEVDVETEEDAQDRFKDGSAQGHSSPFMFQADLARTSGGQAFLCVTFNHSVFDVLSILQWYHDLDHWIQDIKTNIPALTSYRLFSDLFTQYEESVPAQNSVAFHVRKLRGISRYDRALWPPQKAPGMMIANDQGSPHARERLQVRNQVWNGDWESRAHEFQFPRNGRVATIPGLPKLQDEHGIHPALFTKSAIILFNVLQTGSMSIDGPTVQWILNMTEVVRNETVIEFLKRMTAESEELKQHEHVPWNKVVEKLSDEGEAAIDASFRQSFVWDVSLAMSFAKQGSFKTFEPVARYDWADCGFFWNAFMVDSMNLYFIASWDTAQMNDTEVSGHCDVLSEILRKMGDENNWDKKLGDVFHI
ncbi:putative acyl-CoA synthetase YngI [Fusarium culmorum]|uniref:Putative acyl-CoA synthetase YngI n=1 Tax=Fusarium culmorum TaxID=5516 RepID=A0A2T4GQX7_FUSCU|nr:putative acyl-CoA synthetase YngI [Fusarium culmorum]